MTDLWAIAWNTVVMATRRVTTFFALSAILISSFFIFSFVEGDNTLAGLLRVVINWNFGFMSITLMLLVLYLASNALDSEFIGRQITLLTVKPAARWKVLVGKWMGVALMAGFLILLMGTLGYGTLWWLSGSPRNFTPKGAKTQGGLTLDEQWSEVEGQLFVSRTSWRPQFYDLEEERSKFKTKDERKGSSAAASQLEAHVLRLDRRRLITIDYNEHLDLFFNDLTVSEDIEELTVRYKLHGRRGEQPAYRLDHEWTWANPQTGAVERSRLLELRSGLVGELRLDSTAIAPDGTLRLSLHNRTGPDEDLPAARLIVPAHQGVELLIPSGRFECNYARGMILLWIRLVMLAGIGVAANTFLRGPVAAFLLFGIIVTGSLNSFVYRLVVPKPAVVMQEKHETHDNTHGDHDHEAHGDHKNHSHGHSHSPRHGRRRPFAVRMIREIKFVFRNHVAPVLFRVLPDFDATDPAPDLAVGREIGCLRLAGQAVFDVGFRAGLFLVIGLLCFYRREIGLPASH